MKHLASIVEGFDTATKSQREEITKRSAKLIEHLSR